MKRTGSAAILASVVLSFAAPPLESATLPRKVPEFAIQMPDGTELLLSSFREKQKSVVLVFILTTCPHCQAFTRLLNRAQTDFGPRGLQVIESAIEQNAKAAVPDFIRAFQPPFPVGYNPEMAAVDLLQHPRTQIMHMPVVAFINRAGDMIAQYEANDAFMQDDVAEKNLRAKIEELLSSGGTVPGRKTATKKAPATKKK